MPFCIYVCVPRGCRSLQSLVVQGGTPSHERAQHWVWAGLPLQSVIHKWLLFRAWTADFVQSQTIYPLQIYGRSIIWCEFSGKMSICDTETCIIWEHLPVCKSLFMAAWLLPRENFSFPQLICWWYSEFRRFLLFCGVPLILLHLGRRLFRAKFALSSSSLQMIMLL